MSNYYIARIYEKLKDEAELIISEIFEKLYTFGKAMQIKIIQNYVK